MVWSVAVRAGSWVMTRVGWKGILKIGLATGLTVTGIKAWNAAKSEYEEKKDEVQSLTYAVGAGVGILGLIVVASSFRGGGK
jgi:hypothetical protein